MAQLRAMPRAARFEDTRLRAESRSTASDVLCSQQNERSRLRVGETPQRETAAQSQSRLRAQQSRDCNPFAFRYNPAVCYGLSQHVLIGTMTELCPYCKALKFNGQIKGTYCVAGKIKLPRIEELPKPSKSFAYRRYHRIETFPISGNITHASKWRGSAQQS